MTSHPSRTVEGLTPGLQLQLVDSDDDGMEDAARSARRPSTASLSRFRSCPQLCSADAHGQDSLENDEQDMGVDIGMGMQHSSTASPRARQRVVRDDNMAVGRSETPTPPSTPGSRRSHLSLKESLASGARGPGGGTTSSPGGAMRPSGRARADLALLGRVHSTDSPPFEGSFRQLDDNHLRPDEQESERWSRHASEFIEEPPEISIDDRMTATEDGTANLTDGECRYHADDSMDKCARWLQSLKMSSSDRLKSRSHIQLPPI